MSEHLPQKPKCQPIVMKIEEQVVEEHGFIHIKCKILHSLQ
jgi:hypothetical protein